MLAYDIASLGFCDFRFFSEKNGQFDPCTVIIMWIRRVCAFRTPSNGKLYKLHHENSTKDSIVDGRRVYTYIFIHTTALTGCASSGINFKPNNKK